MTQFNFNDYQAMVERAQSGTNSTKIGYFKLANDGDEALVRINCSSIDRLDFASVHTISTGGKWIKVSCLNPLGSYNDGCELCTVADKNSSVSKASKKVYIQMLVSYKDKLTGTWSAVQPVIWERPAAYSREIANKLRDYGDLTQVLLKITRNGKPGDMKTTYSLDYAVPTIFKPDMIPMDFSAFNNFNIAKHSYWEKTADEIHTFITTGSFPEIIKTETTTSSQVDVIPQATSIMQTTPAQGINNVSVNNPMPNQSIPVQPTIQINTTMNQPTDTIETVAPTRSFNSSKFSF